MLRKPVPVWVLLVAVLVTASVATAVLLGPSLLAPRPGPPAPSPDFQLQPFPSSKALLVGNGGGNSGDVKIDVKSLNNFTGVVSFGATAPAGVSAVLADSQGSTTRPVALLGSEDAVFLRVGASTVGNYSVLVTGISGKISHSIQIPVVSQNLTLSVIPDTVTVPHGSNGNLTLTISSVNGAQGNLTYSSDTGYNFQRIFVTFPVAPSALPARGTVTAKVMVSVDSVLTPGSYPYQPIYVGLAGMGSTTIGFTLVVT